jgi:UTP--glucose-1-phosphate uridylyltransferase
MTPLQNPFAPFSDRMAAEGLPDIVIQNFRHYYQQLQAGETGLIPEDTIQPVTTLPDLETLDHDLELVGALVRSRTILLKLNGGLGTGMGLEKAKSLLEIKEGLSFLDIIARQAMDQQVPLVLMNSFSTQEDSEKALSKYPGLIGSIPQSFLQHKVPKVLVSDLSPARWPENEQLEWAPPGHGDIYPALLTSRILPTILANGFEYVFVSNADNLGAVLDLRLLGYFASNNLPFMMEVADRTLADRKGGHLAEKLDGGLVLRESAQCPPEDRAAFQDIERHKYFNTNNLWIYLPTLAHELNIREGVMALPMIRNKKNVDPRDKTSPEVYQLESAMGAAIGVIPDSGAIRVPRQRFSPVKTTNDLLAVRSDNYTLTEHFRVILNPERQLDPIVIDLDPRYYKNYDALVRFFPSGPPAMIQCSSLTIRGPHEFGSDVTLVGDVTLENPGSEPVRIPDGAIIGGN